jgi:opacity protein-like surface antigen
MKAPLLAILAIGCLAFAAQAADISGKWQVDTSAETAAQGGRGGSVSGGEFEFKISGDDLTGSATTPGLHGQWVSVPIADGRIRGDSFSFTVTAKGLNGNDYKSSYTGKLVGNGIELTVDFGGRTNLRTLTLKRSGSFPAAAPPLR